MISMWQSVSQAGVTLSKTWKENRHIILTNRISATIFLLSLCIFLLGLAHFGFIKPVVAAAVSTILLSTPIVLNKYAFYDASRIFLSVYLPIACIAISILDKYEDARNTEEMQYFIFRVLLLVFSVIPFMLFNLNEKSKWITALFVNVACVLLYDPLHNLFGVGYYQKGFTGLNYYFVNYIVMCAVVALVVGTGYLKLSFERFEQQNERLIEKLHSINRNLNEKKNELGKQKEELEDANRMIERQRELLALENITLSKEILDKNKQLTDTNQELIRHNNDLQQFSYTVSHNLRGPVASLMGLLNLLHLEDPSREVNMIMKHIEQSVHSLNSVISDLSSIIDIRSSMTDVRQKVLFSEEIETIKHLLKKQIDDHGVLIETNLSTVPEVFSIRPMINSILYNLISNGIKYRSPDRAPKIRISTSQSGNFIRLNVTDNGLGFDIDKTREKLFGLYKRFHTHTEGKGLGLFLVKLQAEALDGHVEVNSTPGEGTTFSVFIKTPDLWEEQILLDSPLARISFKVDINTIISRWKRDISLNEGYEIFNHVVEFMKNYRVPNWITDLSHSSNEEDEISMVQDFYDRLQRFGMRRMAFILPIDNKGFPEKKMNAIRDSYTLEIGLFNSMENAIAWIEAESGKDQVSAEIAS